MSHELTPKQERFCQKYIELGDATKAYYAAYDAKSSKPITANRAAKELLDNPKIAARVRALRDMSQERHLVTVDSLTAELDQDRQLARELGQPSAAITAVMGKAKLHGIGSENLNLNAKIALTHEEALEQLADDAP